MRKIVARCLFVLLMFAAFMGMGVEAFYPKPITLILATPVALVSAIWLRNALAPYASIPSSKSFGPRNNRMLRGILLVTITVVAYLALVYFGAAFLTFPTGRAQYRVATVNDWDPDSRRPFTHRRSGRCTRLSATVETGDGNLNISQCIGGSFPIILGQGSAIFIETVESPFGTTITGQLRFRP